MFNEDIITQQQQINDNYIEIKGLKGRILYQPHIRYVLDSDTLWLVKTTIHPISVKKGTTNQCAYFPPFILLNMDMLSNYGVT